jgi:carbon storage regulator
MLIIRRREGEKILIGENIELEVLSVSGGRVKIGIDAPADVPILRKELYLARQQNVAAARGASPESLQAVVARFLASTPPVDSKTGPSLR